MTIPDYQTLMRPVLAAVADGSSHRIRDLVVLLADKYKLSPEERNQLLPSGAQRVLDNRVGWAASYMKKAGLLSSPQKGFTQITSVGLQVLKEHPDRLDNSVLAQFPSFQEFKAPKPTTSSKQAIVAVSDDKTPEESLEATWSALNASLGETLLAKIKDSSPKFFEMLVLDLLVRMGYGGSLADAATMLGKSGDQGVDGVIKEDKLGLDMVYVQAKRWDQQVGGAEVQAFAGSLEGHHAQKGVFITTSTFSPAARAYVEKIQKRIVLIDGQRLVELMIEYNVGTAVTRSYEVKRMESDYFEEDPLVT